MTNQLDVIGASQFSRSRKSKGLAIHNLVFRTLTIEIVVFLGHLLGHYLKVVHAAIDNDCPAIVQQEPLVVEVVLKMRVFNGPDMVRTNVEKDTNIEGQTIDPLDQIGLARNLHDQVAHAICDRLSHHLEQVQTFRCGQGRLEKGLAIQGRIHGRQHGRLVALFQDMVGKISSSGLALGPCEGQQFEFSLWMAVKFHGQQTHGLLDVLDQDDGNAHLIVHLADIDLQTSCDSFFQKFFLKSSPFGKEEGIRISLSAIIADLAEAKLAGTYFLSYGKKVVISL